MQTIERNPDIDLDTEEIPAGMQLVEGKQLQHTARAKKIRFGVATRSGQTPNGSPRRQTIGLLIRDADVKRFKQALVIKEALRGTPGGKS